MRGKSDFWRCGRWVWLGGVVCYDGVLGWGWGEKVIDWRLGTR